MRQFYVQGVQLNGTNSCYTRHHLGSTRELVDNTSNIVARYDYHPYGRVTKIPGTTVIDADFQFSGYYEHATSGLILTKYRAYDPNTGKWINRGPLAEQGGVNLYEYCGNDSLSRKDTLGLVGGNDDAADVVLAAEALAAAARIAREAEEVAQLQAELAAAEKEREPIAAEERARELEDQAGGPGGKVKMPQSDNQAANRFHRAMCQKYGLIKEQKSTLHDIITGKGYSKPVIEFFAKGIAEQSGKGVIK